MSILDYQILKALGNGMEIVVKKHLARPGFDPTTREDTRFGFNHSTTNTPTVYSNAAFQKYLSEAKLHSTKLNTTIIVVIQTNIMPTC